MSLSRDNLTPGALVLGAGGNVGFGVVGALLEAGSPVLAVGREGPRMSALAEHFDDEPGLELLHAPCIHDDRDAAENGRDGKGLVENLENAFPQGAVFVNHKLPIAAKALPETLGERSGVLTGSGHFANVGDTRRQGAELLLSGRLPGGATWSAAYGFLDATFRTPFSAPAPNHPDAVDGAISVRSGDRLPLLPRHDAKVDVEVPLGKVRLGLAALYESDRYYQGDEANLLHPIPGFYRVDLDLSRPLGRRVTAFLEVRNLLDAEYATFGILGDAGNVLGGDVDDARFLSPASPRSFLLGLSFR